MILVIVANCQGAFLQHFVTSDYVWTLRCRERNCRQPDLPLSRLRYTEKQETQWVKCIIIKLFFHLWLIKESYSISWSKVFAMFAEIDLVNGGLNQTTFWCVVFGFINSISMYFKSTLYPVLSSIFSASQFASLRTSPIEVFFKKRFCHIIWYLFGIL